LHGAHITFKHTLINVIDFVHSSPLFYFYNYSATLGGWCTKNGETIFCTPSRPWKEQHIF
jgi:hypothetical protein